MTLLVALLVAVSASAQDAASLYQQGRYAEAEVENRAARSAAGDGDAAEAVSLLVQAAAIQRRLGQSAEAARSAQQALERARRDLGPTHPAAAAAERELAECALVLGRYEKGLAAARSAAEATSGGGDATAAESLRVLAELQLASALLDDALRSAERAVELQQRGGGETADLAAALGTLGLVQMRLADLQAAERSLTQALAMREKALGDEHPLVGESLAHLGYLYWSMAQGALNAGDARGAEPSLEKARDRFERARAIRTRTLPAGHPSQAFTANNLAEVYRDLGRGDEALPLWQSAADTWRQTLGEGHPNVCATLTNIGTFHWENGDLDDATEQLEAAAVCWEKAVGPQHPSTAQALNLLAAAYQTAGENDRALATYRHSLPIDDRNIAAAFAVTDEEQKLRFLNATEGHYLAALSLVQRELADDAAAVRFALETVLRRKGIILDAQARTQEAMQGRLDGEAARSWRRLGELRAELARLTLRGPGGGDPAEYGAALAALQEKIQREETALRRRSPIVAAELEQREVTVEAVAERLPEGSVLIEFVKVPNWDPERATWGDGARYLAFVLDRRDRPRLVQLLDAAATEDQIAATRETLDDKVRLAKAPIDYAQAADKSLGTLYETLLEPVEAEIGEAKSLMISPDGELHQVPFAALRRRDRYLVETTSVAYVASGRDLVRPKSDVAPGVDIVMVANPAFDLVATAGRRGNANPTRSGYRGIVWSPLDGAAREGEVIPPLVKGSRQEILRDSSATEAAVRAVRSPRILHFATHGFFFDTNPAAGGGDSAKSRAAPAASGTPASPSGMTHSGLVLSGANYAATLGGGDDGILTALEVSGMDLRGTDLVVLSACDSARGDLRFGLGVYGLRRAFVQAGARNLLMTLWPVRDRVALEQMERFYRDHEAGQSAPEALRHAQLATIQSLREQYANSSGAAVAPVRIWAPFIVQQAGG